MRNYNANKENNFIECINNMTLKKWHDHNSLVVDMKNKGTMTFEDLCLGLGDIKDDIENHLGHFKTVDVRIH